MKFCARKFWKVVRNWQRLSLMQESQPSENAPNTLYYLLGAHNWLFSAATPALKLKLRSKSPTSTRKLKELHSRRALFRMYWKPLRKKDILLALRRSCHKTNKEWQYTDKWWMITWKMLLRSNKHMPLSKSSSSRPSNNASSKRRWRFKCKETSEKDDQTDKRLIFFLF